MLTQEFEQTPITRLKVHPRNARKGVVSAIAESIDHNGFFGAIVAQRSTGHILVGNHRYLAAKERKMDTVPVMWVDVDDNHAVKILLADNRTNDLSVRTSTTAGPPPVGGATPTRTLQFTIMDPNAPTQPGKNGGTLKRGGSPGRRKGGFNLEKLLRELMEENKGELGRAYAKAQILLAMKGNGVAIKEINGRLAGPITEKHESSGEIRVIYEDGHRDKTPEVPPGADGDLDEPEAI